MLNLDPAKLLIIAVVAVIAVAGALVWRVWQAPNRDDLSTFGGFAVAVIVPVATLIAYLTRIRRPEAAAGRPLGELADSLAGAVQEQWSRAALERQLVQPEPIPVQWMRSSRPLAGPMSAAVESRQFPPLPGVQVQPAGPNALRFEVTGSVGPVVTALAGHPVTALVSREPSLEEIFLHIYDGHAGR